MYQTIEEGKAKIKVPVEKKISKELPVFYNPVMKLNRDISVILLRAVENKDMMIGLPLAGSGVRAVRFLKELPKSKIKELWVNDLNPEAIKIIKDNFKLNKIKAKIFNMDANKFILESAGFDYIDIDPFGSPNFLLNNSIVRLSRGGILAVTATDTGCLCGSFPKAGVRKYWAKTGRNDNMHETGLRILIRKVQLVGAEHDKALIPIFSYSKDHYFRVFFRCEKGKTKADKIMKQFGMHNEVGPMWMGELWDTKLISKMRKIEDSKFLKMLYEESKIKVVGFHNIPMICKRNKLSVRKREEIFKEIKKKGYNVAVTHFREDSIRSYIPEKELLKILKKK